MRKLTTAVVTERVLVELMDRKESPAHKTNTVDEFIMDSGNYYSALKDIFE